VGLASVQIARAHGLTVIGTASTEEGREIVKREGAHFVFDHKATDYMEHVKELTKDRGGVDIILEMLANVNLAKDLDILAFKGRVVVIGSRGSIEINPRAIMWKEGIITAVQLNHATPKESEEIHRGLYAGFENGTLRPIVGHTLPLSEAPQAHHDVISSTHRGNIVLLPKQ